MQLHTIQCLDDTSSLPPHVKEAPALLLNPKADPLMILSAAIARIERVQHHLHLYANSTPAEMQVDNECLHLVLAAMYHQTTEINGGRLSRTPG